MPDLPIIPKPRVRRPLWRRVVRAGLWLLLLLALLHRPIVHSGGWWVAIRMARAENVELEFQLGGNLWSGVELTGIRASRRAPGPAPVEKLSLDRVSVGYDLWALIRGDLRGLQRVVVGTLDVEIRPEPSAQKPQRTAPVPLAAKLREVLAKPLPAPVIEVARLDARIITGNGDFRVRNFRLALSPSAPGRVAWDEVVIPGAPPIAAYSAKTESGAGRLIVVPGLAASVADGAFALKVELPGSRVSARFEPSAIGAQVMGTVEVEVMETQFGAGVTVPLVRVAFHGVPEDSATWNAELNAQALATEQSARLDVRATLSNLVAKVETLSLDVAGVVLRGKGEVPVGGLLSPKGAAGMPEEGAFRFEFAAADLSKLPAPLAGKAAGSGVLSLERGEWKLDLTATADALASGALRAAHSVVRVQARAPARVGITLRDVIADADVELGAVSADAVQVDKVRAVASLRELRATLKELRFERGSGTITASARAVCDEKGRLVGQPEGEFAIHIPALADFQVAASGVPLSGAVEGEGAFTLGQPIEASKGRLSLHAKDLKLGDAEAGMIDIEAAVAAGEVVANKCIVQLPGKARVEADGRFGIAAPHAFAGKLAVSIPDLAAFQPILAVFGEKRALAGSVELSVDGKSVEGRPEAAVKLGAKAVRFDTLRISEARIAGTVRQDSADLTELFVANEQIRGSARAAWKDGRATVEQIDVRLDGQPVLSGSLSGPLQAAGAPEQPLVFKLAARELDVAKLLASLGQPPSAAGKISATFEAAGTLSKPALSLEVKGDGLRALAMEAVPPTAFDARAMLTGSEFKVAGTVRQPLVQPTTFSAATTVDTAAIMAGKLPGLADIPLKAAVNMPAASLAFLPRYVPAIARIDGTAAVSMRVGGTLAKPTLEGTASVAVKTARFTDGAIPVITDFKARIESANGLVTLTQFGGEAGGGHFGVSGTVNVANPALPELALALKSKDVLVLRDDSVLVRAEADIAVRGPLNAARVSGDVVLVGSRFNRDIEILPLALPGRPKPAPAAIARPLTISFPQPPLRDWTFDVAVKTRPDDPFLVRGNLARGKVTVDVHLAGTGRTPFLTGAATIEQFSATLPVSTLVVRRGLVTFSEDAPFQPQVELEAESVIRQHTVIVRVDGPASKPRLELQSEPPLPQQEILSLLTTGSLTGEIGSNNSAMATRAGILVVKGWYKKVFKKEFPLGSSDDGGTSLMDRFEVDFGAIDPKTGRNETTAQLRVTDRLFFIGDLELGGGFSGRVKYLFRFR